MIISKGSARIAITGSSNRAPTAMTIPTPKLDLARGRPRKIQWGNWGRFWQTGVMLVGGSFRSQPESEVRWNSSAPFQYQRYRHSLPIVLNPITIVIVPSETTNTLKLPFNCNYCVLSVSVCVSRQAQLLQPQLVKLRYSPHHLNPFRLVEAHLGIKSHLVHIEDVALERLLYNIMDQG